MNTNWRNRPTTIDYISEAIDYVVSIDESGSPDLKRVLKAKNEGLSINENEKHFTVTACNIAVRDFNDARDMVMQLKHKYWSNALFYYNNKEKRICFHSRDIRGRKGAFNPDIIDYSSFIADLSDLMAKIPITLYASHIDKMRHVQQYRYPDLPYNLCMNFVLERIARDIGSKKSCVVILESRGIKEDKDLLDKIKSLIDYGNMYNDKRAFSFIKGVYFNPKWCQIAQDQMSYWELELADLCAYPIQKYFVHGTRDKAFDILLPKIKGYPSVDGKGLKSFP